MVVARWRRRGCPLESRGVPRIVACRSTDAQTPEYVHNEHDTAGDDEDRTKARQRVQTTPAHLRQIRVDASWHPHQSQDVHWEERDVHADEEQPEIPLAQSLAQHSTGQLRVPQIETSPERKDRAAQQHVMEMRDDEEGVMYLEVVRNRRDHHAGQAADDEQEEEPQHEHERRGEPRTSRPYRRDPAEDLNSRRNRDRRARSGEETLTQLW